MRRREFIILAGAAAATWLPPTALRSEERVIKIVVLGDALAVGYWLPVGRRFSDRLEFALKAKGQSVAAGKGNDTAARGLARLNRSVPNGAELRADQLSSCGKAPVGRRGRTDKLHPEGLTLRPGSADPKTGKRCNSVPARGTLLCALRCRMSSSVTAGLFREPQRFPCSFRVGFRCRARASRPRVRPAGAVRQGHRAANGPRPCRQAIQSAG